MDGKHTMVEGLVAGALAYVAVAGFFAVANVVGGYSPFHTAYLVGRAVGAGVPGHGAAVGVVLAANGIHLLISLLVGTAAAGMMLEIDHHHAWWYAVFTAFVFGAFLSVMVMGVLAAELSAVATWTQVALANGIGTVVIGTYLLRMHRSLMGEIRRETAA